MKILKVILALGVLLLCLPFTQLSAVKAAPTPQIQSVTPTDPWGNVNDILYRGQQANLVLVLNSQVNGTYQIYATLTDANNVPIAFAAGNIQLNGNGTLTLKFQVAPFAFVGVGKCSIVVTDQNYQSVTSLNKPVYIGVLGDLNLDGTVNFMDLTTFVDAYTYYNHNFVIPQNYKSSDINGDGKIDFTDLTIFATAYVSFWNR